MAVRAKAWCRRSQGRSRGTSGLLGVLLVGALWFVNIVGASSCSPGEPQTGSQTNWLRVCESSDDCGDLACLCGTCTLTCDTDVTCSEFARGECVQASEDAAATACDGATPSVGLCLPRCGASSCPTGTQCVAEVCIPRREPSIKVSVNLAILHQELIGFGASFAYDEDAIFRHPRASELLDLLFAEGRFEVVRLRNRFEGDNAEALNTASDLLDEAAFRLGRSPLVLMTSGSPPKDLKANGERFCSDFDVDCTLARDGSGDFDYAGFGEYWRASLEAYESAGVSVDWLSLQNNPDFLPGPDVSVEACRFLPTEGLVTVEQAGGENIEAAFPGYAEALAAVLAALPASASTSFVAPSTAPYMTLPYLEVLDPAPVSAVAVHFYGLEAEAVDTEGLEALASRAEALGRPLLQTEMQAGGFETALFTHHALATANAGGYLQHQFVGQALDSNATALVAIDATSFRPLAPFFALWHYSRFTERDWVRADATSDQATVLATAFMSPATGEWSVVLLNATSEALDLELSLLQPGGAAGAQVFRTTFSGQESGAHLGMLRAGDVLRLPGRSVATVTTRD